MNSTSRPGHTMRADARCADAKHVPDRWNLPASKSRACKGRRFHGRPRLPLEKWLCLWKSVEMKGQNELDFTWIFQNDLPCHPTCQQLRRQTSRIVGRSKYEKKIVHLDLRGVSCRSLCIVVIVSFGAKTPATPGFGAVLVDLGAGPWPITMRRPRVDRPRQDDVDKTRPDAKPSSVVVRLLHSSRSTKTSGRAGRAGKIRRIRDAFPCSSFV